MFIFAPLFHTRSLETLTTNIYFEFMHIFQFWVILFYLCPIFCLSIRTKIIIFILGYYLLCSLTSTGRVSRFLTPLKLGYESKLSLRFEIDTYLYLVVKKHARAGCWRTHRSALKNKRIGFDAKDSSREKLFKAHRSILIAIFSSSSTFLSPKLSF